MLLMGSGVFIIHLATKPGVEVQAWNHSQRIDNILLKLFLYDMATGTTANSNKAHAQEQKHNARPPQPSRPPPRIYIMSHSYIIMKKN